MAPVNTSSSSPLLLPFLLLLCSSLHLSQHVVSAAAAAVARSEVSPPTGVAAEVNVVIAKTDGDVVSHGVVSRVAKSSSSLDQQQTPDEDEVAPVASQDSASSPLGHPLVESNGRSFLRRMEDYYYDTLDSDYLTYVLPALAITGLSLLFPNIVTVNTGRRLRRDTGE